MGYRGAERAFRQHLAAVGGCDMLFAHRTVYTEAVRQSGTRPRRGGRGSVPYVFKNCVRVCAACGEHSAADRKYHKRVPLYEILR